MPTVIIDMDSYTPDSYMGSCPVGDHVGVISDVEIEKKATGEQLVLTFKNEAQQSVRARCWLKQDNPKAAQIGKDYLFRVLSAVGHQGKFYLEKMGVICGKKIRFQVHEGEPYTTKEGELRTSYIVPYVCKLSEQLPPIKAKAAFSVPDANKVYEKMSQRKGPAQPTVEALEKNADFAVDDIPF